MQGVVSSGAQIGSLKNLGEVILRVENISLSFGAVRALIDVG